MTNGDFANGETEWHVTVSAGVGISHMIVGGQLCVSLPANASASVGYPVDLSATFALAAGTRYQLSYQVSSTSQAINFEAKVGGATAPFTNVVDFMAEAAGPPNQPRTNSHPFTPAVASSSTGVAFTITTAAPSTVCVGNVWVSAL